MIYYYYSADYNAASQYTDYNAADYNAAGYNAADYNAADYYVAYAAS